MAALLLAIQALAVELACLLARRACPAWLARELSEAAWACVVVFALFWVLTCWAV